MRHADLSTMECTVVLTFASFDPNLAGDHIQLVHCLPCVPPGQLVSIPGAGLLRAPALHPALIAEKALQEANSNLNNKFQQMMADAGVSRGELAMIGVTRRGSVEK